MGIKSANLLGEVTFFLHNIETYIKWCEWCEPHGQWPQKRHEKVVLLHNTLRGWSNGYLRVQTIHRYF